MSVDRSGVMFRPLLGHFGTGYAIRAPGLVTRRARPGRMVSEAAEHRGRKAAWVRDG